VYTVGEGEKIIDAHANTDGASLGPAGAMAPLWCKKVFKDSWQVRRREGGLGREYKDNT
jgi:hypothetical protein